MLISDFISSVSPGIDTLSNMYWKYYKYWCLSIIKIHMKWCFRIQSVIPHVSMLHWRHKNTFKDAVSLWYQVFQPCVFQSLNESLETVAICGLTFCKSTCTAKSVIFKLLLFFILPAFASSSCMKCWRNTVGTPLNLWCRAHEKLWTATITSKSHYRPCQQ